MVPLVNQQAGVKESPPASHSTFQRAGGPGALPAQEVSVREVCHSDLKYKTHVKLRVPWAGGREKIPVSRASRSLSLTLHAVSTCQYGESI